MRLWTTRLEENDDQTGRIDDESKWFPADNVEFALEDLAALSVDSSASSKQSYW